MSDIVVRPTLKFINAAYIAVIVLILAAFVLQHYYEPKWPLWLPLVLAVLFLWIISRHLKRMSRRLTISVERLVYEEGLLGKSTRTIPLAKVQDVRVDQSLLDRLFGVGSVSMETAGGSSRLVMRPNDRPHQIADEINTRSEQAMSATPAM